MKSFNSVAAAITFLSFQTMTSAQEIDQEAGFEGTLSLSSDYIHRGVSRSGRDVSMAGELSYLTQMGIFGSLQGATVDNVAPGFDDHGELELRYTLGYRNLWHRDWSWSTQLSYYDYPADDDGRDPSYAELQVSTTYRNWLTGKIAYSNDYLNTNEPGVTYEVGATYPLTRGVSLLGTLGYADIGDAKNAERGETVFIERKVNVPNQGCKQRKSQRARDCTRVTAQLRCDNSL